MVYERKSRLSARVQQKLIEHFVAGTTARAAAELVGVQSNTAIQFYQRLRKLIASKLASYDLSGEVEVDESYFGGMRKGKRGRGAAGKVPVFGLLKRGGKVYTAIIPNAKSDTLIPIIREHVKPTVLSTRIHFARMMCWTSPSFITAVSITAKSMSTNRGITSTGSRTFGTKQNVIYDGSTASKKRAFTGS